MKIATWNVNSVRARLDRVLPWLEEHSPDVVCLQETKVADLQFPHEPLEDAGYNVEVFGQPTYNGVAILAKHAIEDVVRGLPDDDEDADRRLLAGIVGDVIVVNVYVPNGKDLNHPSFTHKLEWLGRLRAMLADRYPKDDKLVLCGDFNITFDDRDVYDPEGMRERLHCSTPERNALGELCKWGLHDSLRRFCEEAGVYTWWDYRAGAFHRNEGLRIDHMLMTAAALDTCEGVVVDREARKGKAPSDHAPVIATLR